MYERLQQRMQDTAWGVLPSTLRADLDLADEQRRVESDTAAILAQRNAACDAATTAARTANLGGR